MDNFWKQLHMPVFMMAPMADVTDVAFREMFAQHGKPDIFWTEFVSADGLFLRPIHDPSYKPMNKTEHIAHKHGIDPQNPLLKDLLYTEHQRPIVAQFFSKDPELMKRAAKLAKDLGFDGIDINMGCPADIICKQGSGAAMIKQPQLAQEIIRATQEGAGGLPVSIKTRLGYKENELEEWLPQLLAMNPSAIILHARTKKDMSKVPARWENISRAVDIRDDHKSDTLIIGNGDIDTLEGARVKVQETKCDGVMIGRGMFGNPWLFSGHVPTYQEKLHALLAHTKLFIEILGDTKNFTVMKKHYKAYVNGFDGAKELRSALMEAQTYKEIQNLVEHFLKENTV